MKTKTTYELLLDKYGERYVHLSKVKEYLGIDNEDWLKSKANKNELGFRVFKLVESKKSPYFVDLENFAEVLDKKSMLSRNPVRQ